MPMVHHHAEQEVEPSNAADQNMKNPNQTTQTNAIPLEHIYQKHGF